MNAVEIEEAISDLAEQPFDANFPDHFGFFLPPAGILTVKQVRENLFDIGPPAA
jgi:hypothetical protein